jgi:nucleotide-binding universal stress UspA family protein
MIMAKLKSAKGKKFLFGLLAVFIIAASVVTRATIGGVIEQYNIPLSEWTTSMYVIQSSMIFVYSLVFTVLLAMKALRQKFGINENMTHVEKGLPEEVIPDLAEHLQAGIVVLGTVGRTGISAAFLGNTAEQVIDHLRCDLLVIKPDQYQTPVELDDEEDD